MKTEFSHRRHRPRSRRPRQSAPAALCPAARPDRAARAAERPRAALDTGHGAGSECGAQHGDCRLRPAGAGGLSGDTAAQALGGHGPADALGGGGTICRSRTPIRYRGAGRPCLPNPITMAGRACLPSIPACRTRTIFRSTPGRNCSAAAPNSPISIFSAPITSKAIRRFARR